MGWVWKNDDDDSGYVSSSAGDGDNHGGRCATRKVVRSQCRTEEVEPGKFIRKCEKTEEVFKDCIGRPSEMVQSNKEFTEEDVTNEMVKGSFPLGSEPEPFHFPGLRSDIEAIERNLLGGVDRFFQAAEEFFNSVRAPHIFDGNDPSPHGKRGIPIEGHPPKEPFTEKNPNGEGDFSGLATDV